MEISIGQNPRGYTRIPRSRIGEGWGERHVLCVRLCPSMLQTHSKPWAQSCNIYRSFIQRQDRFTTSHYVTKNPQGCVKFHKKYVFGRSAVHSKPCQSSPSRSNSHDNPRGSRNFYFHRERAAILFKIKRGSFDVFPDNRKSYDCDVISSNLTVNSRPVIKTFQIFFTEY